MVKKITHTFAVSVKIVKSRKNRLFNERHYTYPVLRNNLLVFVEKYASHTACLVDSSCPWVLILTEGRFELIGLY